MHSSVRRHVSFPLAFVSSALIALAGISCNSEIQAVHGTESTRPEVDRKLAAGGVLSTTGGTLKMIDGYRVLELWGTPEQMGRAHGELLEFEVRRVTDDIITPRRWRSVAEAVAVMERFQPERFRRELKALAEAAGVEYMHLVALQLFGDAERGSSSCSDGTLPSGSCACTSYAVFGPATRTGECMVGRNFDYWPRNVAQYASTIIHYRPEGMRAFVTLSWAGVINGWTLMNDRGVVVANNTAYGRSESLEGISTCFMLRKVAEEANTVAEGIAVAELGPRAVGTIMLVAGGEPPDAVELEFDHESFVVRRAANGYTLAANHFRVLGLGEPLEDAEDSSRYGTLYGHILSHHGAIDRSMNFAAEEGVPIRSRNLHCAFLLPSDLTFRVSMGIAPAYLQQFRTYRMTDTGIEAVE